jgi:hypothetical protein
MQVLNILQQGGIMDKIAGMAVDNYSEVISSRHLGKRSFPPNLPRGVSKNQKRKLRRYGKIPGKVSEPQNKSEISQPKSPHPIADIGEGQLMDHLFAKSKAGDDAAQYLYKEIIKRQYPPRSRSFDTQQRIWERVENSKIKKKGRRPSI